MAIFNQIQAILTLLIVLILAVAGVLVTVFFVYKKRDTGDADGDKNNQTDGNLEDSINFLPIDDIRDDMIIDEDGQRFTAAIICAGTDFYSDNNSEKLRKQTAYISFWHTVRDDICYRQSPEDINLGYTINKYKDAYRKLESELYMVEETYNQNREEYDSLRRNGEKIDPAFEEELIRLQNAQKHLAWRMDHINDEILLCESISGNQTDNENKQKIYVFSWKDYGGIQGLNLQGEALEKRASEELSEMAARMTSMLSSAGVIAKRARTSDLIDLVRKTTHPYSGNLFGYADMQKFTSIDDDVVRTDSYDKLKESYKKELSRGILVG